MNFFYIFLFLLSNTFADVKEFNFDRGEFELDSKTGTIKVLATKLNKVVIKFDKGRWEESCEIKFKRKNDELKVRVEDSSFLGSADCEMNFVISLPSSLSVDLENGSGSLSVEGLQHKLDIAVGSGKVLVKDSALTSLEVEIGSGDFSFSGTSIDSEIKIGSGDIRFLFNKILINSELKSSQGNGSTFVTVPKGTTTKVKFNSGVGTLKNSTAQSDSPKLRIKSDIGNGNLEIH